MVDMVSDDDWRTTSTRLRRHGAGWLTIPADNQTRLVITNDPDFGAPRTLKDALNRATKALEAVSANPNERRQTRFSKDWRDIIDAHTLEPEVISDVEWIGVATRAENATALALKAKRAGGIAAPVANRNAENPQESSVWAVKIAPELEWKLLNLIGYLTWQENADRRARRRAQREFEESIKRPSRKARELAA